MKNGRLNETRTATLLCAISEVSSKESMTLKAQWRMRHSVGVLCLLSGVFSERLTHQSTAKTFPIRR